MIMQFILTAKNAKRGNWHLWF